MRLRYLVLDGVVLIVKSMMFVTIQKKLRNYMENSNNNYYAPPKAELHYESKKNITHSLQEEKG